MNRLHFYLCTVLAIVLLSATSAQADTIVPGSTVSHEICKPEPESNGEGEECETIEEWETVSTTETTTETVTTMEEPVPIAAPATSPVVRHPKPHKRHKPHHHHHRAR